MRLILKNFANSRHRKSRLSVTIILLISILLKTIVFNRWSIWSWFRLL